MVLPVSMLLASGVLGEEVPHLKRWPLKNLFLVNSEVSFTSETVGILEGQGNPKGGAFKG